MAFDNRHFRRSIFGFGAVIPAHGKDHFRRWYRDTSLLADRAADPRA